MTLVAGLNIAAYLLGYSFRIPIMTDMAKSDDPALNHRYFHEETLVAALALTGVPALFALIGRGEIPLELRAGFTIFFVGPLVFPALLDRRALRLPLRVRDRDLPGPLARTRTASL